MKIIVGLGNIGKEYEKNRHNCGFMAIDALAEEFVKGGHEVEWKNEENKFEAFTAKIKYDNEEILLVKPTTLMNRSGLAVAKILNFYKEDISNLIIIYDDIDLTLGEIRVREKGSAGTHNGMKSLIHELGTEDFKRIRIGIESRGEHAPEHQDLASFVLSNFTTPEKEIAHNAFVSAARESKKLISP